ncbi:MAG: hypothetical protein GTO15_06435 [Pseudomonas stutzeri]|nr:hypothetical protein [Stutzerimonas stutzeri]
MKPIKKLKDLTIADAAQWSTILLRKEFSHYAEIGIFGDSGADGNITVYVSPKDYETTGEYTQPDDFYEAESPPGTAIKVNAGKHTTLQAGPWFALCVKADVNQTGAATFTVVGREQSLGLK